MRMEAFFNRDYGLKRLQKLTPIKRVYMRSYGKVDDKGNPYGDYSIIRH